MRANRLLPASGFGLPVSGLIFDVLYAGDFHVDMMSTITLIMN